MCITYLELDQGCYQCQISFWNSIGKSDKHKLTKFIKVKQKPPIQPSTTKTGIIIIKQFTTINFQKNQWREWPIHHCNFQQFLLQRQISQQNIIKKNISHKCHFYSCALPFSRWWTFYWLVWSLNGAMIGKGGMIQQMLVSSSLNTNDLHFCIQNHCKMIRWVFQRHWMVQCCHPRPIINHLCNHLTQTTVPLPIPPT